MAADERSLNPKQLAFCEEYVVDNNGMRAYQRAYPGNSDKTAGVNASKLLGDTRVQEKIAKLRAVRAKRNNLTQDRVIQELANIAFGHLGLVCTQGEDGNLTLKQLGSMEEGHLGTLQSVKQSNHYDRDGNLLAVKHNFNMHDKLKALELLGKHLGMYDGSGAEKNNKTNAKTRLLGAVERVRDKLSKRGRES